MSKKPGRPKTYRNKKISVDEYTISRLKELFCDSTSPAHALEMLIDGHAQGFYEFTQPFDLNRFKLLKDNRKEKREKFGKYS